MKEINQFISFEKYIYELRNKEYDKSIIEEHYILNRKKEEVLLDEGTLSYNPDILSDKTLFTSNLIAIIDEAIVLSYSNKIKEYKACNEIMKYTEENMNNWMFYEFFNRMEYICRCANNKFSGKGSLYEKKISVLYENEAQLCILNRWNKEDVAARDFIPYTEEYYERR